MGDKNENSDDSRQSWGGKLEFFLTCVGFAVGLGNVWRFPYLAYQNGGGAFLIPYILMLFLIGIPMFYLEISFGQFASLGPLKIWNVSPLFKGVGCASVIVATYIALYFNVIVSWCFYFLFASMGPTIPWKTCNNTWNTDNCVEGRVNSSNILNPKTPSEEYFYNNILDISSGIDKIGSVRWQLLLLLLLSWIIVFCVLLKGVKSMGKVMYFVSIFPYFMLTAMLIRGATLTGAKNGIEYYITPKWNRLKDIQVWADAATQIFYSLGICMGGLIAMSSYNPFKHNCLRDALIVPFINCGTSIYAGFVIFSLLGYMANEKGVDVSQVATEGPGLVFVVYPEGLATMPLPQLWSIFFFLMMTTIGFSSQFSIVETVVGSLTDEFPRYFPTKKHIMLLRLAICVCLFLLGIPMVCQGGFYIFDILNNFSGGYPLLVAAFFEVIAISYFYGINRFADDICMMLGRKASIFWKVCWCFVTPMIILAAFVLKAVKEKRPAFQGKEYPNSAVIMGWLIAAFPISFVPVCALYRVCVNGGWEAVKSSWNSTEDWGPADPNDRIERYALENDYFKSIRDEKNNVNNISISVIEKTTSRDSMFKDYKEQYNYGYDHNSSGFVNYNGLNNNNNYEDYSSKL